MYKRQLCVPSLIALKTRRPPDGTAALRVALAAIPAGRFEVWVTHQVNITALTGEFVQMGEGLLVDAAGAVQGRSRFE